MQQVGFAQAAPVPELIDPFGRQVTYLRVSVTDRCDFRCVYCMAEDMTFLPKKDVLSLEELDRLCSAFVARGVRKLRLTGGEPLVRQEHHGAGPRRCRAISASGALDELTLTTNGTPARPLCRRSCADCGVRRINVSLDTLDPGEVQGDHPLGRSRQGAGRHRGGATRPASTSRSTPWRSRGVNEDEIDDLIRWSPWRAAWT